MCYEISNNSNNFHQLFTNMQYTNVLFIFYPLHRIPKHVHRCKLNTKYDNNVIIQITS